VIKEASYRNLSNRLGAMDPVSVSSGIAGLITLAIQVSSVIADFVIAVKEGPKDIQELHQELLLLGEVLGQLQDFLHSEKAKGRSFDSNSVMQSAISSCKARIERIGDKLRPSTGGKMSRLIDRLKWPFESKEVAEMVTNLRSYTQAFQFSLTIEGW
jgi:Fungal N-terminal domain of STAND proteins